MNHVQRPNPESFSAEERAKMAHRFIKKHDVAAVLLHWFNALVWFLELLTGAGLIVSEHYRFAPLWFTEILLGLFGSRTNMLHFHIAVGVLWTGVLLVYGLFGFRHYAIDFYKNDLAIDRDDLVWLVKKTLHILGRKVSLPEQGIYNAGQKGYAWIMSLSTLIIIVTGFAMAFHLGPQWLIQWSIPVHFAAVGAIMAGLIIHVYMGAILPEERPAFYSMFHGKVNELYAYEYHTKWWRKMKEEERKFHDKLSAGIKRHTK